MLTHVEGEFFSPIPESIVARIETMAVARDYAPGDFLFREGEPAVDFEVLVQGHVRLQMGVPGRGQVLLLSVGPGEILAWSALLSGGKLTASGMALDAVRTVSLPGEALRQLCEEQHDLGYHVMRQLAQALSRRLLATRLQLLDLFAGHEPLTSSVVPAKAAGDPEC